MLTYPTLLFTHIPLLCFVNNTFTIAKPFLILLLTYPRHLPHYKLNSAVVSLLPLEMLYGPVRLENQHNMEGINTAASSMARTWTHILPASLMIWRVFKVSEARSREPLSSLGKHHPATSVLPKSKILSKLKVQQIKSWSVLNNHSSYCQPFCPY